MFPFQEGSSHISYDDPHYEDFIHEDQILDQSSLLDGGSVLTNFAQQEQQQPHTTILPSSNTNTGDTAAAEDRKTIRKEIERQRRQQMSVLHASLRSLLPLELIKGKRSMSDHLNEAMNYIKYLKRNIGELNARRNDLKRLSDPTTTIDLDCVMVRPYLGGYEIVITRASGKEGFLLSRVLEALLEEGLDVDNYVSTKNDDKFYTTIHCQATDLTCIDKARLQQKLNVVVLSST